MTALSKPQGGVRGIGFVAGGNLTRVGIHGTPRVSHALERVGGVEEAAARVMRDRERLILDVLTNILGGVTN